MTGADVTHEEDTNEENESEEHHSDSGEDEDVASANESSEDEGNESHSEDEVPKPKQGCSTRGKIEDNDFVIFEYEGEIFPGLVVHA